MKDTTTSHIVKKCNVQNHHLTINACHI